MSTKGFLILGAITLAAAVLAAMAVTGGGDDGGRAQESELLLPELLDRVNEVAAVEVTSGQGSTHLERSDGGAWVLADKGGYPAKVDTIRPLIIGLAQAEVDQRMTSRPEMYARLGVADADAEGSASRRVTLRDAAGEVLADVIVGDVQGTEQCYVRPAGGSQALLVSVALRVQSATTNWIERKILGLETDRVERCRVQHPDGEVLEIVAGPEGATTWEVQAVPEGRELSSPSAGNTVAMALSHVSMDDVAPVGTVDFEGAVRTEYVCADGLVVAAFTKEVEGTWWTRYEAFFQVPDSAGPVGPTPQDPGTEDVPPPPGEPERSEEEVRAEVDELNASLSTWAFAVSSWKAEAMVKRMDDLLREPEPEPEPAPAPAPELELELAPELDHDHEHEHEHEDAAGGSAVVPAPPLGLEPAGEPSAEEPR